MSALDFTARGLALRAAAQTPLLFEELARAGLPETVTRIDSNGFATVGLGAGDYVSDELCDAALHAAHPAAVFAGAGGRRFRLAGDLHGYVTPEQFGCPPYAPGVNQLAYIQAAIDYAQAVGLRGVLLGQPKYELWRDSCVPTPASYGYTEPRGHFLVVRGRLRIASTHADGTVLHFRGPNGGNLMTDYSVVNGTRFGDGMIHRGSGITLWSELPGSAADAPEETLPYLHLENVTLFTDMVANKTRIWPSSTTHPNAFDSTNKGIACNALNPPSQIGGMTVVNCRIVGFLGENIYTGNYRRTKLIVRNLECRHTNAQPINPSTIGLLDVDGLLAVNCGLSLEGWTGLNGGRLVNATFKDCGAGSFFGGNPGLSALDADGRQPAFYIDAVFNDCDVFYAGSYTYGRLKLIDTQLFIYEVPLNDEIVDVDLDVTSICHKRNMSVAVYFYAKPEAAAQSISNVNIRLNCIRSRHAKANGLFFSRLVSQAGSLGPNCVVAVRSTDFLSGAPSHTFNLTGLTDYRVKIVDEGLDLGQFNQGTGFDATTNPTVEPMYYLLRATFGGASGQYAVSLPPTAKFNDGHEVVIEHRDSASPNATMVVDGRALLGYQDRVKLRCNRFTGKWAIVEAPAPRKATASIDIGPTALGAESGPYAIPLKGCRPHMAASVVPPAAGVPGFVVSAVLAGTDEVKFWVRNMDGGNPSDPAAANWTAYVRKPET